MTEFTFDEKTHRYYLDGKPMTGCTTILGIIAKPALIGWAAKMASEYVRDNLKSLDDLEEVCDAAKGAHRRKRDDAASKGTDVHLECETYINKMIAENDGLAIEGKHDNKQVQAFIDWSVDNEVKFTMSEEKVYSVSNFVAGTLDFGCEFGGHKYIGDIKTTSGIYGREPFAQTAGYQMMKAEMEGKKPSEIADRRIIVNLKKTGNFNPDKDVYVSEHYEDDIELFMSALMMYRNVGRFAPLNYQYNRKNK